MCDPKSRGGMGFKESLLFNEALLAKQTWRLFHNTNSLFYRVFKSRFFPNGSIMEASEGRGGSYVWKSILKGREVIKRGAKWRVGTGEDIKIWGDNWLPSLTSPRVYGPLNSDFQEATVSTLINPLTRSCDTTLLHCALNPTEADLLQKSL